MMGAHATFLQSQIAAGMLVAAGPVMYPADAFRLALFEAESMDAVHRLLEKEPANAIGCYEATPMWPTMDRPARPTGT